VSAFTASTPVIRPRVRFKADEKKEMKLCRSRSRCGIDIPDHHGKYL
jgi:hypothetical protein